MPLFGESVWRRWERSSLDDELTARQQTVGPRLRKGVLAAQGVAMFAGFIIALAVNGLPPYCTLPLSPPAPDDVPYMEHLTAAIVIELAGVTLGLVAVAWIYRREPRSGYWGTVALSSPVLAAWVSTLRVTNVPCTDYGWDLNVVQGTLFALLTVALLAMIVLAYSMDTRTTPLPKRAKEAEQDLSDRIHDGTPPIGGDEWERPPR